MTTQEWELLSQGRVPAEPIIKALTSYLDEMSETALMGRERDLAHLQNVADRGRLSYLTLVTWVERPERVGPIPFLVADRILCATDNVNLWQGELAEYYEQVDMNWQMCECPGCTKLFRQGGLAPATCEIDGCESFPKARGLCNAHYISCKKDGTLDQHTSRYNPERRRIYCSEACKTSAYQQRKGITSSRRKSYLKDRDVKCRNGHDRTPQNTKIRPNGKRECIICHRESSRRGAARAQERKQMAVAA